MYRLKLSKKVIKFLNKRNKNELKIITAKFEELKKNPYPKDNLNSKKLVNSDKYRLRVGKYRFIYIIIENELLILMENADSRGDIYK